jgi:cytochrome c-type biogenesis protein CcmH/NrfG
MLSSRNIHFAILGIILGATSGYIFAFYQIEQKIPDQALPPQAAQGAPQGHPDVSNERVLAMFKEQIAKNPTNVELLSRYGDFLSDIGQFQEAVDAYKKVLALDPKNLNAQTFMGTALWNLGKKDEAIAIYQKSLQADPNHMATLYYLALVDLDHKDVNAAAEKVARLEKQDPTQPILKELKQRIEEERKKAK